MTAFLLWYPHGLYRVAGLDRILLVMLGIDLTAGPLLTLIVYRQGKRSLKFDLAVIAAAQLAFLLCGLATLWQGRPVFLVGTPDTYTLVFANEVADADLAQAARPEWRRLSWTGPQLVATRMPDDAEARRAIIEEFMAGGAGIERTPKYYRPYGELGPALIEAASRNLTGARTLHEGELAMPIVSRRGEGTFVIDARDALPQRTLPVP